MPTIYLIGSKEANTNQHECFTLAYKEKLARWNVNMLHAQKVEEAKDEKLDINESYSEAEGPEGDKDYLKQKPLKKLKVDELLPGYKPRIVETERSYIDEESRESERDREEKALGEDYRNPFRREARIVPKVSISNQIEAGVIPDKDSNDFLLPSGRRLISEGQIDLHPLKQQYDYMVVISDQGTHYIPMKDLIKVVLCHSPSEGAAQEATLT